MLSKSRIKLIQSLRLNKFRKQHGLFVAEGATNVLDFLKSGIPAEILVATSDGLNDHGDSIELKKFQEVSEREMKQLSNLKNPSGILGVFRIPEVKPIDLKAQKFTLMLERIRDPGNLGTIIRTADWFGIRQIICSEDSVDAYNPKVVQGSMGSLARVEVHYAKLDEVIAQKPGEVKVYGAVLDGADISQIEKPQKGILLIGSEAHGISSNLLPHIDHKVTIQAAPTTLATSAESLNASIATAILCYELRR
jgi:TrmH family RNA methyltransferase